MEIALLVVLWTIIGSALVLFSIGAISAMIAYYRTGPQPAHEDLAKVPEGWDKV